MSPARTLAGAAGTAALLAAFCGGVAAQATSKGGDGSSCGAAAARVQGKNSATGIDAQYRWIAQKYPGARMVRSTLLERDGIMYDQMTIRLVSGESISVCFDVSGYFGRF